MQQTLPDIQRQGHAFNFEVAAVFQGGIDIAHIQRRAEVLPVCAQLADINGNAGCAFYFCQHLRAPAVEMR
ncbi:hypothetical protein D3C76_1683130 [compost metagenome]